MDAGASGGADNARLTAGFTFLGQFLDHDLTFDPTSSLEGQNDPGAIRNFRTPMLELDSVYGAGPGQDAFLYDREQFGRLLTSPDGADLQRNHQNLAIIGDPRNDENLIVSQLHLAFIKFHNAVLAAHAGGNFEEAQRLVRWHYQWMVLHEFLPLTCGEDVVAEVIGAPPHERFFQPEEGFIPVEFSVAAYRFGHSQVRPGYRINGGFAAGIFPDAPDGPFDGNDLRGRQVVTPARAVDWRNFFGAAAQAGKAIDTKLSSPLLRLPDTVVGPRVPDEARSLAIRNLERSIAFALPAGQTVARHMRITPLTDAELWRDVPGGAGLAPLWFYILREAELGGRGERLHGVGARIVAEVFIGLIQADKASFVNHDPGWTPTLPAERAGDFTMVDLLRVAGVM